MMDKTQILAISEALAMTENIPEIFVKLLELQDEGYLTVEIGIKEGKPFLTPMKKHLLEQHDQASHAGKGAIPSGYNNWNSSMDSIFEAADKLDDSRGNSVLNVITERAGFNAKPQFVNQAEFDALEGAPLYRGVTDQEYVNDFNESIVQYGGEGIFGNGTYFADNKSIGERYAGTSPDTNVIEAKLSSDANVLSFSSATEQASYADNQANIFIEQYKQFGANPADVQQVQLRLSENSDWTNLAIMQGIDAIEIKSPVNEFQEEVNYMIILNRGKVIVNGKS